jgi:predicted enzyme related to lactoylglutathione lyase
MELVQARIVTDDVERLAAFYASLAGVAVALNEYYVEVPAGPTSVGFSRRKFTEYQESRLERPQRQNEIILDFQVADIDTEYGRIDALGVEWVMPPSTQPWGNRSMIFRDPDGNLVNVFSSGCGLACLLDPGRDRCADLHRAADRAQPVMRLHHHVRQDRTGRIALLPAGKHDPVRHLDVGEVVAVGVPDLVRAREHLERFRLSPARRQDVDIDGRAPADRGEQQFGGGEVFAAGAKRDLAAPDVGGGEPAVRGALDGYVAVLRTSRHGHSLSDAYPRADWRPGGRAAED